MSFYSGSDGHLWFAEVNSFPDENGNMPGQVYIAKVKSWSFTSTTQTLDVTVLGDTDRNFREGIRSASGSCSLFYYTTVDKIGSVQQLIEQQLGARDQYDYAPLSDDRPGKFWLKLLWGRGNQDPHYIIVGVSITSLTITMAVGEMMSADISFDVNGAPIKYVL